MNREVSSLVKPVLINTSDLGGGAAKVAMDLHQSYVTLGLDSKMLVAMKQSDLPSVYEIQQTDWYQFWHRFDKKLLKSQKKGAYCLHKLVKIIEAPHSEIAHKMGKENYHQPGSKALVEDLLTNSDIFHLHNLHYDYFDLRMLPDLSRQKPVVITMHDEYLYTGLCTSTLGCERWRNGCGNCPQLALYPDFKCDNSRFNWNRKKAIFSQSQLTLVTPSQWLARRARESLLSTLPVKVIPNGIDLNVFKQGSKAAARDAIGLDQNAFIILYVIKSGRKGKYKDIEMLERVVSRLQNATFTKPVILLTIGGSSSQEIRMDNICRIEKGYIKEPFEIAQYFQACDLYVHTTDAETFGLVVAEAMACGAAVISTNAGGIPELVREGVTGYTVPIGDDEAMVSRILQLIDDPDQLSRMGEKASKTAREEYGSKLMVDNYLNLYQELVDERKR